MNVALVGHCIAAEIMQHGHMQMTQFSYTSGVCVVNSPIWRTLSDNDDTFPAIMEFCVALAARLHLGDPESAVINVIRWNDLTSTEDVLDTLRSL